MQSNNPVFRRSEAFNGQSANVYGNQTYTGNGQTSPVDGSGPATVLHQTERPGTTAGPPDDLDSIVQKTAISLFVVIAGRRRDVGRHPPDTSSESNPDIGPLTRP